MKDKGMSEEKKQILAQMPGEDYVSQTQAPGAQGVTESSQRVAPEEKEPWELLQEAHKERKAGIKASKESGAKHLDDYPAAVEAIRGKEIYNLRDPKERGIVSTVSNRKEVVVRWADEYSAQKNSATAIKDKKGNVIGRESWLSADDRQDYVVSEKETPTQDKAQGKIVQPEPSQQAAAQKPVNSVMPGEDYAAQVKKLDDDTNRLLSDGGFQISGKQPKSKTGEADLLKKGYKPYLVNGKGELEVNVLGVWAKPTAGEKEIADGKRQKAIDKYIEHMIPHSRNQ